MGFRSFLASMIGEENVNSMKKVYDRTAGGLADVAYVAEQKWDQVQQYKAENEQKAKDGVAWYDDNRVQGPKTQYQNMVDGDRPIEPQTLAMFGAGKLASKLAPKDIAFKDGRQLRSLTGDMEQEALQARIMHEMARRKKASDKLFYGS